MTKSLLGVDIGSSSLNLALQSRGALKCYSQGTPENMLHEGALRSPHSMAEFLNEARKKSRLKKAPCALLLPDGAAVCRRLTMPVMTEEQLLLNLPYEFRDYVSSQAEDYKYDYAVLRVNADEEGVPTTLELMAAAASKSVLNDYAQMFKRAGLKLTTVLPREMAYIGLIRSYMASESAPEHPELCFVDIGSHATRVHIFNGLLLEAYRTIDIGGSMISDAIAENQMIDAYKAELYKQENTDNVLDAPYCREIYRRLSVEVMKSINFYRFNNQSSEIANIYFCGGEAANDKLTAEIAETVQLEAHSLAERLPLGSEAQSDVSASCLLAAAVTC